MKKSMRAAVFRVSKGLVIEDVPVPELRKGSGSGQSCGRRFLWL